MDIFSHSICLDEPSGNHDAWQWHSYLESLLTSLSSVYRAPLKGTHHFSEYVQDLRAPQKTSDRIAYSGRLRAAPSPYTEAHHSGVRSIGAQPKKTAMYK